MIRNLTILLMLLIAACAARGGGLEPIGEAPLGPYRLGGGDSIRINVYGLDTANAIYLIGDGGTISIPLVGQLAVDRKTVAEVELLLAATLREKQLINAPSVSVQIDKYRPFFILGEVQKPGQYAYVPGMSVLTAVSIAGGYTFRAQTKRATIVRGGAGGNRSGSARPESTVQPGDTVSIAEAWF